VEDVGVALRVVRPGKVRRTDEYDRCRVEDQRARALRMRGREERAHRSALPEAEHRGALRADGVEDGPQVVDTLLERRELGVRHAVREAGPSLVDEDHPREARQASVEGRQARLLPHVLQV
jgi:hypothetical protein